MMSFLITMSVQYVVHLYFIKCSQFLKISNFSDSVINYNNVKVIINLMNKVIFRCSKSTVA